jgi:26S proteasome regulatory subunit N5
MADNINPVLGNMAKDPKATEDYSKEADETMVRADTMVKAGRLEEAVEELLAMEKKARLASDGVSTAKLAAKVIQVLYEGKEWAKMRDHLVMLSKKRGQLKRTTTEMVHLAMTWLDAQDKVKKIELIETLNEVTAGKIFVEVEKARLTKILATIKEEEGNIEEAANLLQEVQVETFGAMDRREKTEYILNQMRLVLAKKDFIRTQIISKKLNPKLLEVDDLQDLKIQFYEYMINYYLHEKKMLDVCKCYQSIYNTKSVQADEAKWKPALTAHTVYLLLAMFDNEQSDMLNKLHTIESKKLDKVPAFKTLVKLFLTEELLTWPVANEADIKAHVAFQADSPHEGGAARWELFEKRVVQHNIKVVSGYYEQIHITRLCELIGLSQDKAEKELSELVCSKFVHAKIDRPGGQIKFGQKQTYTDRLNDWSGSITKMLDLVENTCHLIQKEQMVHAARAKLKPKK